MNYFEGIEKQEQLKKILNEWIGTPFKHHCGVKNLGCDCIHFVYKVFEEMGIVKIKTIPVYGKDWHVHNTRELLSEAIEKHLNVEKINLGNVQNGDIILSHYGKAASHAAIYFGGYVYQSLTKIGVRKINFNDKKFKSYMKFGYRILN